MTARHDTIKSASSARLLISLREHEAQAAALRAAYGAAVAVDADGMLYWIAEAAKELRLGAGRKLVHPAASGNMDQSTLYRFERHQGQPESIDATIAAYADDLDMRPIEIWAYALQLWQAAEEAVTPAEEDADRLIEEIEGESRTSAPARPGAKRLRSEGVAPARTRRSAGERRGR